MVNKMPAVWKNIAHAHLPRPKPPSLWHSHTPPLRHNPSEANRYKAHTDSSMEDRPSWCHISSRPPYFPSGAAPQFRSTWQPPTLTTYRQRRPALPHQNKNGNEAGMPGEKRKWSTIRPSAEHAGIEREPSIEGPKDQKNHRRSQQQ